MTEGETKNGEAHAVFLVRFLAFLTHPNAIAFHGQPATLPGLKAPLTTEETLIASHGTADTYTTILATDPTANATAIITTTTTNIATAMVTITTTATMATTTATVAADVGASSKMGSNASPPTNLKGHAPFSTSTRISTFSADDDDENGEHNDEDGDDDNDEDDNDDYKKGKRTTTR